MSLQSHDYERLAGLIHDDTEQGSEPEQRTGGPEQGHSPVSAAAVLP